MDYNLDILDLIFVDYPEIITIDVFLYHLLRKISCCKFISHLQQHPPLYNNVRNMQKFWYSYSLQYLPEYLPYYHNTINWLDFVLNNSYHIYRNLLGEIGEIKSTSEQLNNYIESERLAEMPTIFKEYFSDPDNEFHISLSQIRKYIYWMSEHNLGNPSILLLFSLILIEDKLYLIRLKDGEVTVKLFIEDSIVDIKKECMFNYYALNSRNQIYKLDSTTVKIRNYDLIHNKEILFLPPEISDLKIKCFLPFNTSKFYNKMLNKGSILLFLTTDGNLYINVNITDTKQKSRSIFQQMVVYDDLSSMEKMEHINCHFYETNAEISLIKFWNNNNKMFILNMTNFLVSCNMSGGLDLRFSEINRELTILFHQRNRIVQLEFTDDDKLLALDDKGNFYLGFLPEDKVDIPEIIQILNNCTPFTILDNKVCNFTTYLDSIKSQIFINYFVRDKVEI